MSTNNRTIKAPCALTCKTLGNGTRNPTPIVHSKGIGLAQQPKKPIQQKPKVETKNAKNVKGKKKQKNKNLKNNK